MQSIQTKISQAKSKLLLNHPFFGAVAAKLELVQNDDIQSFKSNGIKLEYNSDFLQKLEPAQMEFVFANGAMHASLEHEARKNGRSGWLWQLSTDYAINDMLVQNGLERPDEAHYSKRFSGMYAEEIYAELKEDILRDELEYEADDINDMQDSNKEQNEQNSPQNEDILNEQLFEEFAKAKLEDEMKSGEAPLSIGRFFKISAEGKIDWRNELRAALDRHHKDDYTLLPPSKKFLYAGIYLPSCISKRFQLVVAVDSSGSVDEKLLSEFLSELNFLMLTIPNFQIDMFVCDDKIRTHKTFWGGDILEVELKGGGGTDFRPVFEFVDRELLYVKLLLYFSDLDGIFPHDEPNYEVKWIAPKEQNVPFGTVITLE
ncbi:MAG: VWA-like domain-containing protein [Sulfurimonas sp.]|uniref:vWA domain-containing protein n=1 Tax=Sulfurimonas sp. TaxID=2022749 RepID=UPI0028CC1563|nr:VWA-like domain-containing protein [Sulfurimonas sp.]MDT8338938.1 VWA-like domain-containing protein [Sulfurimonas sp.]